MVMFFDLPAIMTFPSSCMAATFAVPRYSIKDLSREGGCSGPVPGFVPGPLPGSGSTGSGSPGLEHEVNTILLALMIGFMVYDHKPQNKVVLESRNVMSKKVDKMHSE